MKIEKEYACRSIGKYIVAYRLQKKISTEANEPYVIQGAVSN